MLANNPLSDKRLLKLVIQCQTKSCMDYIKKSGADSTPNKPKKSKTSNVAVEVEQVAVQLENVELEEEKILDKIIVDKYDDKRSLKITYSPGVKDVRQFALFCIVKNCFFTHSRLKVIIVKLQKLYIDIYNNSNFRNSCKFKQNCMIHFVANVNWQQLLLTTWMKSKHQPLSTLPDQSTKST